MNISIKIATKISECSNEWDALLPGGHHLKSKHLQAFENAAVEDIETNYVLVLQNNNVTGLLYLQSFSFQHKHLNFNTGNVFISRLIKYLLPAKLPILVCGHLFRINFQGFYCKDTSSTENVLRAIQLFTKLKGEPAGIIIKDCEYKFSGEKCRQWGFRFFNGDVTMEIERNKKWLRFDDYINDLHKNYRQRAKKIIASFKGVESKLLSPEEILYNAAVIEQLYLNVVNKQTVKLGIVNTAYFYELKKDLQDDFEFYALYSNNKMVGFYTFILYQKEMETHFIGLDYEANATHKLYFNILFAGISRMIERRFEKLELGRTARDAKANTGAAPKQVFNYTRVKNRAVAITLQYFLNRFNKKENSGLKKRNPLK